jgi:hypothetical protein
MNLHDVPCITSFHPPEPDYGYDEALRRTAITSMENLDVETFEDAMDLAGSHNAIYAAVVRLLSAAPKDREKAFNALYNSVLEDLEKLIEKNGVDEDE